MKMQKWCDHDKQMCSLGNHSWSVSRLIEMSGGLEVMDVPLDHLMINYEYNGLRLRDMVKHMNAVNDSDLAYPIILDEDGELMDGRHRIMKALMLGEKTIKAVRFEENPTPCKIA